MSLTRKRPEDKSEQWQPATSVRLYLDDIDEILAILRQLGPAVSADAGDFAGEIASAEELKQLQAEGSSLHSLVLQAGSQAGQIRVRLRCPVAVRIEPRDDLRLAGAGRQIHELLNRRELRSRGSNDVLFLYVVCFGIIAAAWIALFLGVDAALMNVGAVSGLTVGVLTSGVLSLFGRTNEPEATVVLAYRREAPTWWEKNKTSVLIGLATNLVVAAVFLVLGLWLA